MTLFAEFHNSNLYHIMRDENHTACSISVVAQDDQTQTYAATEYPLPQIVSVPSPSRKPCKDCLKRTEE